VDGQAPARRSPYRNVEVAEALAAWRERLPGRQQEMA
jgi:hypothetical protein